MQEVIRTDWFEKWASYSPIKVAIRDAETEESLTYQQLNNAGNDLAMQFLQVLHLKKGDRICVLAEFSTAYIALFAAAVKSGIVLVPLNYRLAGPELDFIISNADPSLIITDEKFENVVGDQPAFQKIPYRWKLQLLKLKVEESISLKSIRATEYGPVYFSDPLFILYTSGTTGFPKGAIYTHQMAFWNSVNTQLRLNITSGDHTLTCMPPFHTGGWNVLLTPFLHHGASVTLLCKFDASEVLQLLEEEDATIFMGVPTMIKMMSESPLFKELSLGAMRYLIVGGEAMPIPLIEQWQKKGIPIRQGYGLTEVGPNVTSLHQADALRKIGSIGKPNFYVNTRLVNAEGKDALPSEEGELWLHGPMVTPGYWKNEEATKSAIEDGWFKTGDILVEDDEGYLYVKDRIKNMFISGGENVYPAEVEKVLQQHEMIQEVAVKGVPDTKWGEVGKAYVIKLDEGLDEQEVLSYCQGKLAKFKIPKHIHFVENIPKTDSGKIDRKNLESLDN